MKKTQKPQKHKIKQKKLNPEPSRSHSALQASYLLVNGWCGCLGPTSWSSVSMSQDMEERVVVVLRMNSSSLCARRLLEEHALHRKFRSSPDVYRGQQRRTESRCFTCHRSFDGDGALLVFFVLRMRQSRHAESHFASGRARSLVADCCVAHRSFPFQPLSGLPASRNYRLPHPRRVRPPF